MKEASCSILGEPCYNLLQLHTVVVGRYKCCKTNAASRDVETRDATSLEAQVDQYFLVRMIVSWG